MDKDYKKMIIIMVIAIAFFLNYGLLISGTIPEKIGKMAAINYVQDHYAERILMFEKMEFSAAHGDYFAVFKDSNGKVYNFLMSSKLWPTSVLYDPLRPPGP